MLTLDQKIRKWSRSVNRNKTFTPIEMEEMEDHLLVEIKQMVQYDHLTEEEAFRKATETLGEQGILDVEYGKIRWSAFFKVKLWTYLQTFIILGLVIVLIAPYVHLPKKEISDDLIGYQVGVVDDKNVLNYSLFQTNAYVIHKNQTYYYNDFTHGVMGFGYDIDSGGRPIYFSLSSTDIIAQLFEIDSQENLYKLYLGQERSVDIFHNSQMIRNIQLSDKLDPISYIKNIKVLDKKLIVCVTQEAYSSQKVIEKHPATRYERIKFTNNSEPIFSYLLVNDLSINQSKFERITLKNVVLSMDRSEDELALLSDNGTLEIYSIQNNRLSLKDKWIIKDFDTYIALNDYTRPTTSQEKISLFFRSWWSYLRDFFIPSYDIRFAFGDDSFIHYKVELIYCKTKKQFALMGNHFDFRYSYLKPTNNKELSILPLRDKNLAGLIKIGFLDKERLVLVKNNTAKKRYNDLEIYLFKE